MFGKKLSLLVLPLVATLSLHASDPFNDPFFNDPFGDDIFKEMMQMQRNMDKMFERMHQRMQQRSSGLVSPLGTYKMSIQNQLLDKGDHYELKTNIPESKENHIDITTTDHIMSITAKIVQEKENKTTNMVSQSRSVRMYQQSMTLPNDADEGTIKTAYKNGKLIVTIAKKKIVKPQSVSPKVESKKEEKKTQENNITIKKTTLSDRTSMS
jgi:HSP20 family molecular chaperone IbpA